jgi:biopolymer transport protein ExbD
LKEGAEMGIGDRGNVKSDINVIPLVAVLVVLLCIMMISTPIVDLGVGIRLPEAVYTVNKPNPDCGELTVVSIARDRSLYVNCKQVTEEEFAARVTESLERHENQTVLISADEAAPYSSIMAAMDSLRGAEIATVSLVVAAPANPPRTRP